jgi:NAD(P)-dependent dehydrogenase (short-subunit alcohol dehydrogenase family)
MIGDVLDDLAAETATGLGGRATHLDVTDEASWEAAVAATVDQLGGLDILVNNAGSNADSASSTRPAVIAPAGDGTSSPIIASPPSSAAATASP